MLTLASTRVDERGHFRYVVGGAAGNRSVTTDDLSAVVETLVGVGVRNPYRFLAHAVGLGRNRRRTFSTPKSNLRFGSAPSPAGSSP